jgi:hypothetical protein
MDEDEDGEDVGPGIKPDTVTGLIDVKKIQVPTPGKPTVEQKLKAFFDDPEKSIKIFMSSYSRSMGYIWYQFFLIPNFLFLFIFSRANANLDCIPRVVHYFVNFLLRSKVLPHIERELRRSLEVIGLAIIELPNTSNIAKTFPDKFSLASNACWGQKADGYMTLATSEEEPVDNTLEVEPLDNTLEEEPIDNTLEEPEAKRQKCDTDIAQPAAPVEPEKDTPADTTDTWVTGGDSDWGVAAEGSHSWGQNIAMIEENMAWASLKVDKPESLLSLLGPTVLPLTHSPGIVERSMRRIVSITRPPSSVAKSPPLPDGIYEPNADAVELELDRCFAKVVLAPMIDWDGGESPVYTKPAILATSRGAVVVQDTPASPTPVQGSPQPHNPASDEITVLIDDIASQIDYLREGMAIGGTWVQLVRQGEPAVAKKKKGKSKKSSYWYLDELAIVVPSFWTIDD